MVSYKRHIFVCYITTAEIRLLNFADQHRNIFFEGTLLGV